MVNRNNNTPRRLYFL